MKSYILSGLTFLALGCLSGCAHQAENTDATAQPAATPNAAAASGQQEYSVQNPTAGSGQAQPSSPSNPGGQNAARMISPLTP